MKRNLLNFALLAFMLVSNFVMFAQPSSDGPSCVECEETPIDGTKLLFLALTGIAFAFVYFVKTQKSKKAA